MKNTILRTVMAGAAVLALSACETVTLAPAGMYNAGSYDVELKRDWSAFPFKTDKGTKLSVLSADGLFLNRMYLYSDVESGDSLLKKRSKEEPAPVYMDNLSDLELVELVGDTLMYMGYQNVETADVSPEAFEGEDGLKFSFSGQTADGLNIKGQSMVASSDNGLDAVIFLAAEEYYYDKYASDIDAVFASLQ